MIHGSPKKLFALTRSLPLVRPHLYHSTSSFFKRPLCRQAQSAELGERLPVVTALKNAYGKNNLFSDDTLLVYVHHALRSSKDLLKKILELGIKPYNTFVYDKYYSRSLSIVSEIKELGVNYQPCSTQVGLGKFSTNFTRDINWLWGNAVNALNRDKKIKKILLLDHGGYATSYIPGSLVENYDIIAIPKTTADLIKFEKEGYPPFPVINLAKCVAKSELESPFIAEALVNKIASIIPVKTKNLACAVIGYGAVGAALASKLRVLGHRVIVQEIDPARINAARLAGFKTTQNLSAAVGNADFLFGCTGTDISEENIDVFDLTTKHITAVNCASDDREFLTILQRIQHQKNGKVATTPLATVTYENGMGGSTTLPKGGFPANFDDTGVSVPEEDIQLTRAMVYGAVLQAAEMFKSGKGVLNTGNLYALDAELQKFIVQEWLKYQPKDRFEAELLEKFQDIGWIAKNSGGKYFQCDLFSRSDFTPDQQPKPVVTC